MRNTHITLFILFIASLIGYEFFIDPVIEFIYDQSNRETPLTITQLDSVARFLRLSLASLHLFTLTYLMKYLRGHILIKAVPFLLFIHLLVQNPNLNLISANFSLAEPYIFSLISAGVMVGLFIYTEREYIYNDVEVSVHPIFDNFLDLIGFLSLIVIPLLIDAYSYGFIPYFIIDLFTETPFGFGFVYAPLFVYMLMGIWVVVYQASFQSFYLYRLIILIGLTLIYSFPLFLGNFGSEALISIHRLGLWVLAFIYLMYLNQVSKSPYKPELAPSQPDPLNDGNIQQK